MSKYDCRFYTLLFHLVNREMTRSHNVQPIWIPDARLQFDPTQLSAAAALARAQSLAVKRALPTRVYTSPCSCETKLVLQLYSSDYQCADDILLSVGVPSRLACECSDGALRSWQYLQCFVLTSEVLDGLCPLDCQRESSIDLVGNGEISYFII